MKLKTFLFVGCAVLIALILIVGFLFGSHVTVIQFTIFFAAMLLCYGMGLATVIVVGLYWFDQKNQEDLVKEIAAHRHKSKQAFAEQVKKKSHTNVYVNEYVKKFYSSHGILYIAMEENDVIVFSKTSENFFTVEINDVIYSMPYGNWEYLPKEEHTPAIKLAAPFEKYIVYIDKNQIA